MLRTQSDLARAAKKAGATLVGCAPVTLRDGSSTIGGRFEFEDPWAAARLLAILSDEDASDPVPAAWASSILSAVVDELGPGATRAQVHDAFAEALHANVQRQIRFEPEIGEQFQSARATMINGVGDCDCHARLVHAMARSQGMGSALRFFEQKDEPTHVVSALETTTGPAWAETTIDARFAEHPLVAFHRLGLDATGTRRDLGFLGLEFVSPSNVRDYKKELDGYVSSIDADVAKCATMTPEKRAAWTTFRDGWRSFMADDPGYFNAGGQGRHAAHYADQIRQWQSDLTTLCVLSSPNLPAPPTEAILGVVTTIAIAMGVSAVAGVAVALIRR
jgi:hypothetical protein